MAALHVVFMSCVHWFIILYNGYSYTYATIARLVDAMCMLYATWDSFDIDAIPVLFSDAQKSLSLAISEL